ncbi:MAG: hypothetical protein KME07_01140 [Pegethrix bostrychoides GSE-TBD4-15B]|jgi:DNA-directed RNA polymerase specialized sigma24 family protein|uniref:Sigma-70 family RNA polymerase sigma factor n=1 Tax=Pegethrix bostrychoides GSE-TBD4-15B TaxID=2839662 RepID=A0A951P7X5_9CYAN|nr:hypothetical protein [Pegethrix bostrychoides GSE-TBD4-15B]
MVDQEEALNSSAQMQLDAELVAQVKQISACPSCSPERQMLLNQFVNGILRSGRLGHPQRSAYPPSLYIDLYNEALQKTLIEICQKIDQYKPEHPVMAWVNFRLNCQFIEVVKDYQKQGMTQMPKAESRFPVRLPSLEDLPLFSPAVEDADMQIQQFLRQDPEGRFQKLRLRERPDVTFQALAIAKFVEGKAWPEIAKSLDVPAQTLCSFFNRQLRDLVPYFKQYLEV